MAYCQNTYSAFWWCVSLILVIVTVQVDGGKINWPDCYSQSMCGDPLEYYKALRCTPVFKKDGDCCPWRYDCDHLHDVMYKNQCLLYYSIHDYKIGDRIKEEDANLCEENCICTSTFQDFADFNCTTRKAFCPSYRHSKRGCYSGQFIQCCPELCSSVEHEGCTRNGNKYLLGEFIVPEDDPYSICKCKRIKYDSIFLNICKPPRHSLVRSGMKTHNFRTNASMYLYGFKCLELNTWFNQIPEFAYYKNCVPVYSFDQYESSITSRKTWRCQNDHDFIIAASSSEKSKAAVGRRPLSAMQCPHQGQSEYSEDIFKDGGCLLINPEGPQDVEYGLEYRHLCRFGQILMQIDEELNRIVYGNDSCIVCTCFVPPVPTCVLQSIEICKLKI